MSKQVFKATDEQIEELTTALKGGAPILLALQYAKISRATYYYWVAMASVVQEYKSQKELEEVEQLVQSGVSLQQIRDISDAAAAQKRTGIGTFIEPSEESLLQYKNSRKFRKFADRCYEIITECDKIRSKVALVHLNNIRMSVDKKNRMNASGSMWFLERTLSDFFAKPNEKEPESERPGAIEPIKVEYVDPNSDETKDRVAEMEQELQEKINGKGMA